LVTSTPGAVASTPVSSRFERQEVARRKPSMADVVVEAELNRLASFAARMVHAQSCFIFVPTEYGQRGAAPSATISHASGAAPMSGLQPGMSGRRFDSLELKGYYSTIDAIQTDARVPCDSGLIGWIVKQQRPLHISPFENDSRVLGAYVDRVAIRSFIGLPIVFSAPDDAGGEEVSYTGALLCDHAQEMAFSRGHGQALQEVAHQIGFVLRVAAPGPRPSAELSWRSFLTKGAQLCDALGFESLAVIRLRSSSFAEVERELGTERALELDDRIYRLITQALPPHFPVTRLPQGDVLVLVDMMMATFFENKIRQLIERVTGSGKPLDFQSSILPTKSVRVAKGAPLQNALEAVVTESSRRVLKTGSVAERVQAESELPPARPAANGPVPVRTHRLR
jgi:hypothetical protein